MTESANPDLPQTVPTPRVEGGDTGPASGPPKLPAVRRKGPRYLIGEEVARGGMAAVYRGRDT